MGGGVVERKELFKRPFLGFGHALLTGRGGLFMLRLNGIILKFQNCGFVLFCL